MEEEKPPLLDLCPELRNKIYDLVVPSPDGIIVLSVTSGNEINDRTATSLSPPRVFKTGYYPKANEYGNGSLGLFGSLPSKRDRMKKHIMDVTEVKDKLSSLRTWLDSVPEDSTRHMRDVRIDLGTIQFDPRNHSAWNESLKDLFDTWSELQQQANKLGLSGTRATRFGLHFRLGVGLLYRLPFAYELPLRDRSEAGRKAQRAVNLDRADLLKSQNEHLVAMGKSPLSALIPEFETTMVIQEGIVHVLFD
ncbi:hypothetical protein LTR17_013177 [Elasticomyces elasticus]|nr:hypothetical protein LTR17_013177 [Elasticomyces elasticus]